MWTPPRRVAGARRAFAHEPRKSYWGYRAELKDPDGYLVRLWDERSMKER